MTPSFCKLERCRDAAVDLRVGNQSACVFCASHSNNFVTSPEGTRVLVAQREHRLTQHLFVAALVDFRTRLDREGDSGLRVQSVAGEGEGGRG